MCIGGSWGERCLVGGGGGGGGGAIRSPEFGGAIGLL